MSKPLDQPAARQDDESGEEKPHEPSPAIDLLYYVDQVLQQFPSISAKVKADSLRYLATTLEEE